MTTPNITLSAYQQAERDLAHEGARTGMVVHATITVLVSILLVVINLTVATGFPWSAFAVGGMAIGLAVHWWFGYHRLDDQLSHQQLATETKAASTTG
jgi:hypothetical protein